jgi:hypothetical protein
MPSTINATPTSSGLISSADTSGVLALQTGGTTAVTIDASQNVCVGTTTALNSSSNRGNITIGGTSSSMLNLGTGTTTSSYLYHIQSGNELYLVNAANGPAIFYTNNTERMRITSGGALCVGTTSATGAVRFIVESDSTTLNPMSVSNTRATAATDYAIIFYRAGNIVGSVQTSLSATSFVTSSDYRLKENIVPMTGALAKVAQLNPVTYDWKAGGSSQGFIAHELQAVVPDCVVGEKDEVDADGNIKPQGVDTSFLVATLTAAIQELKATVDAQATAIAELQARLPAENT